MATIFGALPVILQNGTLADAAQVMADFNKIIADGNANAAENGANSSITSLSGLTSPISALAGSSSHFNGSTSGGSANAQTVATVTPNNWSLTSGNMVSFQPGFSNTGALTLAVAGGSALAVRKMSAAGPVALIANDMVAGQNATVVYDGTAYLLINPSPLAGFGTLTNLASAATTDLGTVGSHNVNITGTTTITSFGSSASTQAPYYFIEFASALTLTYNATSLIIPGAASVTTAAGDTAIAEYLGSGNWQISFYQKANGQALVTPSSTANVLVGIQVFTASGTYTPNAAATRAFAIVTGGGGGGGGGSSGNGGGGGGGAGGTTLAYMSSLSTLSVSIGPGGGSAANSNGTAGTGTSLGTITANGGGGGTGGAAGNTPAGGTGASATGTGTLGIPGGDGGIGHLGATSSGVAISGQGGGSFWGGGAKSASGAGVTATVFGAGGSGGVNAAGGTGANGVVVVFEFK